MVKETIVFPEVGFPKDFKEKIMRGSKEYNFDYLFTRGFAVVYTVIADDEGFHSFAKQLTKIIENAMSTILVIRDMDKPPKEYFDDVLFKWYDLIKGTEALGYFPLQILFFITQLGTLFSDEKQALSTGTIKVEIKDMGKIFYIILSNKKEFTEPPLSDTIIRNHESRLRELIKKHEEKEILNAMPNIIKNNNGITIVGNNNSISNNQFNNNIYFEPIYDKINEKNPPNKDELIDTVKKIEKEGLLKKYLKNIQKNAPWIIPMVELALKLKGI